MAAAVAGRCRAVRRRLSVPPSVPPTGRGSGRLGQVVPRLVYSGKAVSKGRMGRNGIYRDAEWSPTNQKAAGSSPAERTTNYLQKRDFFLAVAQLTSHSYHRPYHRVVSRSVFERHRRTPPGIRRSRRDRVSWQFPGQRLRFLSRRTPSPCPRSRL